MSKVRWYNPVIRCLLFGLIILCPVASSAQDGPESITSRKSDASLNTPSGIYVSVAYGSDDNPGTIGQPYKTIQKAVNEMVAGDTCYIMEGTYREEIRRGFVSGSSASPLVICAYPGHDVTLDGTVEITAGWEPYQENIYRAVIDTTIWQLFVDNDMMTSARWPNVEVFSRDTWIRNGWARMHASSTLGTMVDDASWSPGNTLAGQEASFNGAMAILNLNYWTTGVNPAEGHEAGSGQFNYNPTGIMQNDDMFQVYDYLYGSYYFIEGSLACLDAPGEWYFNPETRELYLWTKDGGSPAGRDIRGKTQTYAIEFTSSKYIQLKDLAFFGTTFSFKNCFNITVQNCSVYFPSYSKRMLGSNASIQTTRFLNGDKLSQTFHRIRNCTFAYSDGAALEIWGSGNIIENCLFHDIDYSCHGPWSAGTISSWYTKDMIFRGNTIHSAGNSETVACGESGLFEWNDVYHCGMLQGDGAIFQFTPTHFSGSVTRYNWIHDTKKRGIRLDDGGKVYSSYGTNARIDHNVAWNCVYQGIQGKGDQNKIFNNLVFDNHTVDLNLVYDSQGRFTNGQTITVNNAAGNVSQNQNSPDNTLLGISKNNWISARHPEDLADQLRDPANRDFRPRPGSSLVDAGTEYQGIPSFPYIGPAPDIGPYEFGDSTYRIPGRKLQKASHPVPANKGISHYEFVDLMWREGFLATSHDVYFGTDSLMVGDADHASPFYRSNQQGNVFNPGGLTAGETYYWRVDVIRDSDTTRGDVWSFTAGVDANPPVYNIIMNVHGSRDTTVIPLEGSVIRLGNRKTITDKNGITSIEWMKEGHYSRFIQRKGYTGISDSVYITSDTLFNDTLKYTTFHVTFQLVDMDSGEPIGGGEIMFDSLSLVTGEQGTSELSEIEYTWYSILASATGYIPYGPQMVEIWSDTSLVIALQKVYRVVSVQAIDRATGDPVYRARISYGNELELTNSSGEAALDKVPSGTLIYTIEHNNYFQVTDSVIIEKDTSFLVRLTARLAEIEFNIRDTSGPVAGAFVSLNDLLFTETGIEGRAFFFNQPARQKYGYEIRKEGYETITDSVFLEMDTTINQVIRLVAGLNNDPVNTVFVYPNSVKGELFIHHVTDNYRIALMDVTGRIIHAPQSNGYVKILSLEGIPYGMYILSVTTDDHEVRRFRIIKE